MNYAKKGFYFGYRDCLQRQASMQKVPFLVLVLIFAYHSAQGSLKKNILFFQNLHHKFGYNY